MHFGVCNLSFDGCMSGVISRKVFCNVTDQSSHLTTSFVLLYQQLAKCQFFVFWRAPSCSKLYRRFWIPENFLSFDVSSTSLYAPVVKLFVDLFFKPNNAPLRVNVISSYQWTKALLVYIRSNLWSKWAQASWMAVVLERQHTALWTLAKSPPGTAVGGW